MKITFKGLQNNTNQDHHTQLCVQVVGFQVQSWNCKPFKHGYVTAGSRHNHDHWPKSPGTPTTSSESWVGRIPGDLLLQPDAGPGSMLGHNLQSLDCAYLAPSESLCLGWEYPRASCRGRPGQLPNSSELQDLLEEWQSRSQQVLQLHTLLPVPGQASQKYRRNNGKVMRHF